MNFQVVAHLINPIAGDVPALDSMLSYVCAEGLPALVRSQPIDQSLITTPLNKYYVDDEFVWCCSDPIFVTEFEDVAYINKRFTTSQAHEIESSKRKTILTASGSYKMQRRPLKTSIVKTVTYFCNGDMQETKKLLKKVTSIGKTRNMGYGRVDKWDAFEIEHDYSITANNKEDTILMRTIPKHFLTDDIIGYRVSHGSFRPPYWHPDNYGEIAIPC